MKGSGWTGFIRAPALALCARSLGKERIFRQTQYCPMKISTAKTLAFAFASVTTRH